MPRNSVDALGTVGHGNVAVMADRDRIGIDTFGGINSPWTELLPGTLLLSLRWTLGGDTRIGDNHIGSIIGHGFCFIKGKGITR
jgi:hypothetical protein